LVRWFARRRFALSPQEYTAVTDYLFDITARVGSGEHAIYSFLAPGVFAYQPLCDIIPVLARDLTITFMYGETDWMDINAARELQSDLTSRRISVHTVPGSGHQLCIENPLEFDRIVIDSIFAERSNLVIVCV